MKKHKMSFTCVEDTKDHLYKLGIVFNTINEDGHDSMTEDRAREILLGLPGALK